MVSLRSVHPKFLFGSGKATELSGAVSAADADTVFVNAPLSGQQQKALSSKWGGAKVVHYTSQCSRFTFLTHTRLLLYYHLLYHWSNEIPSSAGPPD